MTRQGLGGRAARILVMGLLGTVWPWTAGHGTAQACTCIPPLGYVLPLSGSRDVPRNTRVFVYRQWSGGEIWFHPTWDHVVVEAVIKDEDLPEALVLVSEAGTEVPLDVERAQVRPRGPSTWWLAPRALLEPETRYQVRLVHSGGTTLLSEFTTTDEIDKTPPTTLLGVGSATLDYYPGPQPNDNGTCGGQNSLRVSFWFHERMPTYTESPLNGVERVYLRRADAPYDFDNPVVDVPLVAAVEADQGGYLIGWNFLCATGLRIELEECTEWCVRAHPMDLAGNIKEIPDERCAVLSSLEPWTSEGPGERKVCPGEVGPGIPVPPETRDAGGSEGDKAGGGETRQGEGGTCASAGPCARTSGPWWFAGWLVAVLLARRRRERAGVGTFLPQKETV